MSDWIMPGAGVIGGSTSKTIQIEMIKASDGSPLTGLAAASFTVAKYFRPGAASATDISLSDLANLDSAWSSGGIKEIANGLYRLDIVDAAIAAISGGGPVAFMFLTATSLPTNFNLFVCTSNADTVATTIGAAGAGLTALGDTRIANLDATISSRTKPADTQAAVTTVTNLTNAPTNGDLTAAMKASVTLAVPTAANVRTEMDANSTKLANLDAAVTSRLAAASYTAPDNANIGVAAAQATASAASAADIQTRIPAALTGAGNIKADALLLNGTTPPTETTIADGLLDRDMSAGADTNARSPRNALRFLRNKWSVAGNVLTVTKEDDATPAWTGAVSTDAAAIPITGNDPV